MDGKFDLDQKLGNWNYRVIRVKKKEPDGRDWYSIRECYYEGDNVTVSTMTVEPAEMVGFSMEDLHWMLQQFQKALELPVIDEVED